MVICLGNLFGQSNNLPRYFRILENEEDHITVDMSDLTDLIKNELNVHRSLFIKIEVYGVGGSGNIEEEKRLLSETSADINLNFESYFIGLPVNTTNAYEICIKAGYFTYWRQYVFKKTKTLSDITLRSLAEKYAPILLFHQEEEFFPMSLTQFGDGLPQDSSVLFEFPFFLDETGIKRDDLFNFMANNGHSNAGIRANSDKPVFNGSINDSSLYYSGYFNHDEDILFINYILFFSRDYKYEDDGTGNATGSHWLDRESITISFRNKNGQWIPDKVTFAGHMPGQTLEFNSTDAKYVDWTGGRLTFDYSDIMIFFDHPIIALAKGTHAIYPLSGDYTCWTTIAGIPNSYEEPAGFSIAEVNSGKQERNYILNEIVKITQGNHEYTNYIFPGIEEFSSAKTYTLNQIDFHQTSTNSGSERAIIFSGTWIDGTLHYDSRSFPFTEPEREIATQNYVYESEPGTYTHYDVAFDRANALQKAHLARWEDDFNLLKAPSILFDECQIKELNPWDNLKIVFNSVDKADGYKVTVRALGEDDKEYTNEIFIQTDNSISYNVNDYYVDLIGFQKSDNKISLEISQNFLNIETPVPIKDTKLYVAAFSIIHNPHVDAITKWTEATLLKSSDDISYIQDNPSGMDEEKERIYNEVNVVSGSVICGEEAQIKSGWPVSVAFLNRQHVPENGTWVLKYPQLFDDKLFDGVAHLSQDVNPVHLLYNYDQISTEYTIEIKMEAEDWRGLPPTLSSNSSQLKVNTGVTCFWLGTSKLLSASLEGSGSSYTLTVQLSGSPGSGLDLANMRYPIRAGKSWRTSHYDYWVDLQRVKGYYNQVENDTLNGEPTVVMTFPCWWYWSEMSGTEDSGVYVLNYESWDGYEMKRRSMQFTVKVY